MVPGKGMAAWLPAWLPDLASQLLPTARSSRGIWLLSRMTA